MLFTLLAEFFSIFLHSTFALSVSIYISICLNCKGLIHNSLLRITTHSNEICISTGPSHYVRTFQFIRDTLYSLRSLPFGRDVFSFHSPLLGKSLLYPFLPLINMLKLRGFSPTITEGDNSVCYCLVRNALTFLFENSQVLVGITLCIRDILNAFIR